MKLISKDTIVYFSWDSPFKKYFLTGGCCELIAVQFL